MFQACQTCTYNDLITVLNTLVPAKSKYILDNKSSVHVAGKRKYQTRCTCSTYSTVCTQLSTLYRPQQCVFKCQKRQSRPFYACTDMGIVCLHNGLTYIEIILKSIHKVSMLVSGQQIYVFDKMPLPVAILLTFLKSDLLHDPFITCLSSTFL